MRLFNRVKLKKLNTAGIGHHALVAILVISAIAGVGAWRVWSSSAATLSGDLAKYQMRVATPDGCWLAGRVYDTTKKQCTTACRPGTGAPKTIKGKDGTTRAFCADAVAESMDTLDEAKNCVQNLHRMYVLEIGCARRANQENANGAKQCVGYWDKTSPYKNYVAEGNVDRCVAPTIAQTGGNTGAATATTETDPMGTAICQALGRKPKDASNCYRDCRADTGTLLVHTNAAKTRYCSRSVAVGGSEGTCTNLHRVWTPVGCARRPDQTGADGMYVAACKPGFTWYNVNSTASGTSADVCEESQAYAIANEKAGFLGTVNGLAQTKGGISICGDPKKVLSADKRSCVAPSAGSTSGSGTATGSATGSSGTGSTTDIAHGNNATVTADGAAEYRIVLFKDNNFKGSKMTVVATLKDNKFTYRASIDGKAVSPAPSSFATLPQGWDNQVSSFKVASGQWKLCPDKDFKSSKSLTCVSSWAADPNMNDVVNKSRKLNNQVSSLCPVVRGASCGEVLNVQLSEAEQAELNDPAMQSIQPICKGTDGKEVPRQEGECPSGTTLKCDPGYLVQNGACVEKVVEAKVIVAVDNKINAKDCELLGREYIAKPSNAKKVNNGGQYGCSMQTCERDADGAPRGGQDSLVCVSYRFTEPYAVVLSEATCKKLHREYIARVGRCAQEPNRKDKNHTIQNSEKCAGQAYTVYYIFKENGKDDECFKKKTFDNAKAAAKSVGGGLNKALKQGPRAFCNTVKRGNYHWNGKKCVIDRKTCWNGDSIAVTKSCPAQPSPADEGGDRKDPPVSVSAEFCKGLGRVYSNGTCTRNCSNSAYSITNYSDPNKWDTCVMTHCSSSICNPNAGNIPKTPAQKCRDAGGSYVRDDYCERITERACVNAGGRWRSYKNDSLGAYVDPAVWCDFS